MMSISPGGRAPAHARRRADPLPAPLEHATAVLACPHCRGRLRPEERSLVCPLGHRFDVARHGSVRLDVGRGQPRHNGDDRDMIEARRVFFEAGGLRAVTAALATVTEQACGSRASWWLLDVGAGTGHHSEGILDRSAGGHGVAVDVSRHALAAAARRHSRLAAVGADVWAGLPVRSNIGRPRPRGLRAAQRRGDAPCATARWSPPGSRPGGRSSARAASAHVRRHRRPQARAPQPDLRAAFRARAPHPRHRPGARCAPTPARRCIGWGPGHATTSRPVRSRA